MSEEQNENKNAAAAKAMISEKLTAFMGLKEKNPKAFYGILAVLLIPVVLIMFSGGGESPSVSGPTIKDLAVGKKYMLKSPNVVDPAATIRIVPVPGTLAAYDDTEEKDRTEPCQHMPQNTPVEVMDFSDAYGKSKMFVKVKVLEGECKDKDGWVLAIDVQ
jgi:hypothetical protein